MSKLIYHKVGEHGGVSVLDENVKEVIENSDVCLVSPYVGKRYFEDLTRLADSWRLVTDFEEMVSLGGWATGNEGRDFLTKHSERVRDIRDLHAKAIITDGSAIVGSANLTEKGVAGRTEMAVRFNGTEKVNELKEWFESLWSHDETGRVDNERVESALESAAPETRKQNTTAGGGEDIGRVSPVSKQMARVGTDKNRTPSEDQKEYEDLVERVGQLPSRDWAARFFDMFAELIEFTGMSGDDERLVSSMPKDRDKIVVTVNNRYVLVAYPRTDRVGITLPERDESIEEFFDYNFGTLSGESEQESPYFYIFPQVTDENLLSRKEDWRKAVTKEMKKASASAYADSHEPVVYRAAVDSVFRQRVLSDAFD